MGIDASAIPLSEVVDLRGDKVAGSKDPTLPYVGLEHIGQGEPVLLGWAPSDTSISVNSIFEPGDILFGKLRPNLRKSAPVSFRGYCSTDVLVLRARPSVSPAFAARVLQQEHVFRAAVQTAEGTKMPRTSWDSLKTHVVFVPPHPEQQCIAEILDTVDVAIQQTDALIAKFRQMKAGLLHDLLIRGLDEHGQLRDPVTHPEQFKDSPLGRMPCDWELQALAEACELIKDGTHLPPPRVENGPLLLSVQNMIDGRLQHTDADTRVSWEFYRNMHRDWRIEVGDVLLAIVGATIGKTAIVPEFEPFTLQRSVAVLRGRPCVLLSGFLFQFLTTRAFQVALWRQVNQTAQPGIYLDQLGQLQVPFPKSPQEQSSITSILESHDDRIRAEQTYREKLILLKRGLMSDLLTGRVRVKVAEEATA